VKRYVGVEHAGAHRALDDARMTALVLDRMLGRHAELPRGVAGLHRPTAEQELAARLRQEGDRLVFAFGRHAGRPLEEVARRDRSYLEWLRRRDFHPEFTRQLEAALARRDG
jgi:DNA polymerase-3 subunit epsilon